MPCSGRLDEPPAQIPKGTVGASPRRTLGRVANAWSVTATAAGAAVGDEHGTIHLLSATAGEGAAATVKEVTANVGFDTPVLALQALNDGRLVSLTSSQLLQVWRMRDGRLVLDHTLSDRASAFGVQGGNGVITDARRESRRSRPRPPRQHAVRRGSKCDPPAPSPPADRRERWCATRRRLP